MGEKTGFQRKFWPEKWWWISFDFQFVFLFIIIIICNKFLRNKILFTKSHFGYYFLTKKSWINKNKKPIILLFWLKNLFTEKKTEFQKKIQSKKYLVCFSFFSSGILHQNCVFKKEFFLVIIKIFKLKIFNKFLQQQQQEDEIMVFCCCCCCFWHDFFLTWLNLSFWKKVPKSILAFFQLFFFLGDENKNPLYSNVHQ